MSVPTPSPKNFDFSNLLPRVENLQQLYGLLLDWKIDGFLAKLAEPATLSALFVFILWTVFAWFLIGGVLWGGLRSVQRIAYFRRLLRGVTVENLIDKRLDLRQRATQQGRLGSLWTEFDETLVVNETGLHNSFDASQFFNTHTLARGITESRLLAAVPGFLTAIGVIGTFMGLQLGLSGLDLGNAEGAQTGINQLVSGASVAFMTSVWGVGMSVSFNLVEKTAEQRVRSHLANLQHRIDTLFPRANPEQTLILIHDENRKATITLDGLAERIGHEMQHAMTDATGQMLEGMIKGLQDVIGPAVGKLVESSDALSRRQEQGGERVLESLVERFGESFQRQGDEQKAALETAASELGSRLGGWSDSMSRFLTGLETQHQAADQSNHSLVEATRAHIENLEQAGDKQLGKMQDGLNATVGQVIQQFGRAQQEWISERETEQEKLQQETEQIAQRLGDVGRQLGQQMSNQTELLKSHSDELLAKVSQAATEQSDNLVRQQQATQDHLRQINEGSTEQIGKLQDSVAETLRIVTAELAATQREWAVLRKSEQQQLHQEIESVARRITDASESVSKQASSQVASLQDQSLALIAQLEVFAKGMSESVAQHVQASAVLLRQSEALNGQVREVGIGLDRSSVALRDGADHLDRSSIGLGHLAGNLQNASVELGTRLTTLTSEVDRLTREHTEANSGLSELRKELGALGEGLKRAATEVFNASQGAVEQTKDLRQHQRDLQQAMQDHITDLQGKIANLLTEYGQRVQGQTTERLTEWNNQTRDFSSTMVDATKVIAELVDDMESKRPLAA